MMNIESAKEKRVWHKGRPPFVGWWNASVAGCSYDSWRWWDGQTWSASVSSRSEAAEIAQYANEPSRDFLQQKMYWSDYWPENAVCPRLDPTVAGLSVVWKGKIWVWIDGELICSNPNQKVERETNVLLNTAFVQKAEIRKAIEQTEQLLAHLRGLIQE